MNSPYEAVLEKKIAFALREMLAGRDISNEAFTYLDSKGCYFIRQMRYTLNAHGVQDLRKQFLGLMLDGRPWMAELVGWEVPQPEIWRKTVSRQVQQNSPTVAEAIQAKADESRIRFVPDSAFENRPAREWLIPTILPREGIALVFGPPGCGKSFMTIAWALCIATGTPWLGYQVRRGPVAYIAGEGSFGLQSRIKAWKISQQFHGDSGVLWFDEPVALQDNGCFSEVQEAFVRDFMDPPILIVLDTLSRCSVGADENSNTEMARVIASADMLQKLFRCTVLIVHHCGKDTDRGPRGASALAGNTETIIDVSRTDDGCRVSCYKQKDAAKFEAFSLKFLQVQLDPASPETSAVLVPDESQAQPSLRASESVMLTALTNAGKALTYGEWVKAGMEAGLKERTAKGAIASLLKCQQVQKEDRTYMPNSQEKED